MDEYLDIVDDNDSVIGTKTRDEIYTKGLSNFRVVNLFIKNSKGELWLPFRTKNKKSYPECWDVSMGGHVDSGETYEEALIRETEEELNLDLKTIPYSLLATLTPKDGVAAFMKVYETKLEEAPNFNPDDFSEGQWFKPQVFLEMIESGEKAKGDLPKLVKKFYV